MRIIDQYIRNEEQRTRAERVEALAARFAERAAVTTGKERFLSKISPTCGTRGI